MVSVTIILLYFIVYLWCFYILLFTAHLADNSLKILFNGLEIDLSKNDIFFLSIRHLILV